MGIDQCKQYILFSAFENLLYKANNIDFVNLQTKLEIEPNYQQ